MISFNMSNTNITLYPDKTFKEKYTKESKGTNKDLGNYLLPNWDLITKNLQDVVNFETLENASVIIKDFFESEFPEFKSNVEYTVDKSNYNFKVYLLDNYIKQEN